MRGLEGGVAEALLARGSPPMSKANKRRPQSREKLPLVKALKAIETSEDIP